MSDKPGAYTCNWMHTMVVPRALQAQAPFWYWHSGETTRLALTAIGPKPSLLDFLRLLQVVYTSILQLSATQIKLELNVTSYQLFDTDMPSMVQVSQKHSYLWHLSGASVMFLRHCLFLHKGFLYKLPPLPPFLCPELMLLKNWHPGVLCVAQMLLCIHFCR